MTEKLTKAELMYEQERALFEACREKGIRFNWIERCERGMRSLCGEAQARKRNILSLGVALRDGHTEVSFICG